MAKKKSEGKKSRSNKQASKQASKQEERREKESLKRKRSLFLVYTGRIERRIEIVVGVWGKYVWHIIIVLANPLPLNNRYRP